MNVFSLDFAVLMMNKNTSMMIILATLAVSNANTVVEKYFRSARKQVSLNHLYDLDQRTQLHERGLSQQNYSLSSNSFDHFYFLLRSIRAGDTETTDQMSSRNILKSKSSKSQLNEESLEETSALTHTSASSRGTRITGTGASKRNPSIFSMKHKHQIPRWNAASVAGGVFDRVSTTGRAKNTLENFNPMIGRLWAKLSDRGSLLLKIPSMNENEDPIYVELSEQCRDLNETVTSRFYLDEDISMDSESSVNVRFVEHRDDSTAIKSTVSPSFIPLEGIYGVYELPFSGPHAVLVTESEEVYTSPLSNGKPEGIPLIELRRIKSMEIVPLREKEFRVQNSLVDLNATKRQIMSSEEQLAEEARQLRLLRKSLKEHNFYFAVPRNVDKQTSQPVVPDATHSLQRTFLDWIASNNDHDTECKGRHHWWLPYIGMEQSMKKRRCTIDPRFFWNEQPALALLRPVKNSTNKDILCSVKSPYRRLLDQVIPVTSAFIGVESNVPFPSSNRFDTSSPATHESYDQILISRRSKYRTGTRFTRRGADGTGAVANYAETEQICLITRNEDRDKEKSFSSYRTLSEVYSHIQTRGSIPLHWSSPADVKAYRPRVFIGVDPMAQARALRDHLISELWCYSSTFERKSSNREDSGIKLTMVNLIDKHGDQGRLGSTLESVLSAVVDIYGRKTSRNTAIRSSSANELPIDHKSVQHIWYDFHAECKGGRWDRLINLLDKVSPTLTEQAYFCAVPFDKRTNSRPLNTWEIKNLQDGVVRTNCMDCLDRTNVVQSMFGRFILFQQLNERCGLNTKSELKSRKRFLPLEVLVGFKQRQLCLPWMEGERAHRHLWADNADAISRLYAGTPALKGDFTRTGVRTKRGALDDGLNSLQRYFLNNFIDADRQEGMDLIVGSSKFNVFPSEDDHSSRLILLRQFADNRNAKVNVNIDDETTEPKSRLALSWLPGDLRHHMQIEALRSASPLSFRAIEEDHDTIFSSKFFADNLSSSLKTHQSHSRANVFDLLQSIDRKVACTRPWWSQDGNQGFYGWQLDNLDVQNWTFPILLVLLLKIPTLTAALFSLILASGFQSDMNSK